ncbi:MAG: uroporphyrinogen-III C-methyltransferase [Chlorobium sp.]
MKSFLPLNIRIDNRKILFVGGGKIALHKIKTVLQYTSNISIIAPEIQDELHETGFTEIYKEYEKSDLEGFFLVYACTNNIEVNRRIKNDAAAYGIMVNVVDNRELSDFISPAVIKKDEMTIAVSSNGENVKKSVEWRNKIKAMLQHGDFFTKSSEPNKSGYVSIIGAGPGDPELLTIKAQRVLREADVILYDDLVSSEIVDRFDAEKIYTGKRKESHHFEQEAINEELVCQALQGKKVARLKGGDPFIFGRGGEEIEALRQHGIRYEIIPGITAAHGASAYTEIPLTMRKISSSVAFCTGHPVNKIQVPDADTLVYYMVASTVHEVLEAVAEKGRDENTMVAIVQNATCYNQKIITGTLGELRKSEHAVSSPALLVLGKNINQFIKDNWYSKKKKVLIAGEDSGLYVSEEYTRVLFSCKSVECTERHNHPQEIPLDLDFIDEIYFSSLASLRNFSLLYKSIPEKITVKTASRKVNDEYKKLFQILTISL